MMYQSQFIEMFSTSSKTRIGDICDLINGDRSSHYPKGDDFVPNGIPFINAGHIQNDHVDFSKMDYITQEKYDELRSGHLKVNDIIYCLRGSLGKHCIIQTIPAAIASSLVILRITDPEIEAQFLDVSLSSSSVLEQMNMANNGSAQPNLSAASVASFEVPHPTKEGQKRFVSIVQQADKSKFDGFKSQFIEKSRCANHPVKLGDLFDSIRNGANIKQGVRSDGYPITRIETIADGFVNRDKMGYAGIVNESFSGYYLHDNDILMSHINSMKHIGKSALYKRIPGETIIHGMNLLCLRLKDGIANPVYILYLLQSDSIREEIRLISKQAVNQASFTVSDLKNIRCSIPGIGVQEQFEIIAQQADKSKYMN